MKISTGFLLGTSLLFGVLLFAVGCGQKEAKTCYSVDVFTLEQNVKNMRVELHEIAVELDRQSQKGCGCGDKCKCGKKCSVGDAKRLDALLNQATAMSTITAVYFRYATQDVDFCEDEKAGDKMDVALRDAREVINRNAILFDLEFNIDSDRYFEVFRQMNHLSVTDWHEYRVYVSDLTNSFDDICKERIARIEGFPKADIRMPLAPIGYPERIGMKAEDYLKKMKKFWQDEPKRKQSALPAFPLRTFRTYRGEVLMGWIDADGREQERTMPVAKWESLCKATEPAE